MLKFKQLFSSKNKHLACILLEKNMLYFDILGGCIPAVLIVTILQSPY